MHSESPSGVHAYVSVKPLAAVVLANNFICSYIDIRRFKALYHFVETYIYINLSLLKFY